MPSGSVPGRSKLLDVEDDVLPDVALDALQLGNLPSRHVADDPARRVVGDRAARDHLPVAQHGDLVAQIHHVAQPVGDEQDRDPLRDQAPQRVEEALQLGAGEDRRRLVEDQEPRVADEGTRDLDQLPFGDGKLRGLRVQVELAQAKLRQDPARPVPLGSPVDQAAGDTELLAEEDVVDHAHVRQHGELLVDGGDPRVERRMRRSRRERLAVEYEPSGIGWLHAGDDRDERRLARTVPADETVHHSGPAAQAHAAQRLHSRE